MKDLSSLNLRGHLSVMLNNVFGQVDDNGKINRLRRECPAEECGAGVFMAAHFDRQVWDWLPVSPTRSSLEDHCLLADFFFCLFGLILVFFLIKSLLNYVAEGKYHY